MNESEKKRLTVLATAIWPSGFWCDRCGDKYDLPFLKKSSAHNGSSGWRAQCPSCGSEVSLLDKRISLLMRAGSNAVQAVAVVCFVYRISLLAVLTKNRTVRNLGKATSCMIRELQAYMLDSEIMEVLSVDSKRIKLAQTDKAALKFIWKAALVRREEVRKRRERRNKAARARYGRCDPQGKEPMEAREPDREVGETDS